MAISMTGITTLDSARLGGKQDAVHTAALANGGYVVAWTTDVSGNKDVAFQIFDKTGEAVSAVVTANATVTGSQVLQDIVVTDDGSVTLAWTSGKSAVTRSFDSNTGAAVSNERSIAADGAAATGAQLVAVSANQYKLLVSSQAGGSTVLEQATISTSGGVTAAKSTISSSLPAGSSIVEAVDGNASASQFALLSDGRLVSTTGSVTNTGDSTDIIKLQSGLHVLAGGSAGSAVLSGLSGTGNNLATYSENPGSPSELVNVTDVAVQPATFARTLVDLGGGRIMAVWVADTGTGLELNKGSDGIYAAVYDVNAGAWEPGGLLVKDFGNGGDTSIAKLATITLDAALLNNGKVSLSWSMSNGVAGFDSFNAIISAGSVLDYSSASQGLRIDLAYPFLNTGSASGEDVTGINHVIGSNFADSLRGRDFDADDNPLSDILSGGAGDDHIVGRAGNDLLTGGNGDDSISGGDFDDQLQGNEGDDTLYGGDGSDALDGGQGQDFLAGGIGRDTLQGGDGNDRLTGGEGDDIVDGGDGNDVIAGDEGENTIDGGAGVDTLTFARFGSSFADLAYGSDVLGNLDAFAIDIDDDVIMNVENVIGSGDNDYLAGNGGNNLLRGNGGDDMLYGRGGVDRLVGGEGADQFIYGAASDGGDRIASFDIGNDKIVLDSDSFGGLGLHNIGTSFQKNSGGFASGSGPRLVIDTEGSDAGNLYYDADGSGAGARVLLATLTFLDINWPLNFSSDDFAFA